MVERPKRSKTKRRSPNQSFSKRRSGVNLTMSWQMFVMFQNLLRFSFMWDILRWSCDVVWRHLRFQGSSHDICWVVLRRRRKTSSMIIRRRKTSSMIVRRRKTSSMIIRRPKTSSMIVRRRKTSSMIVRRRKILSGIVRRRKTLSRIVRRRTTVIRSSYAL